MHPPTRPSAPTAPHPHPHPHAPQTSLCSVFDALARAPISSGAPGSRGLPPAAIRDAAGELSQCIQEAQRMGCPVGGRPPGGAEARAGSGAGAAQGGEEQEEDEERDEL